MQKRHFLILIVVFTLVGLCSQQAQARKKRNNIVRLETTLGTIRIALSDLTPIHRDNFKKLVSEGFYDGVTFHRVIKDFMIQAGDPQSRIRHEDKAKSKLSKAVRSDSLEYTIPAEIVYPELYHRRGMVAAAREADDVNPEFRSSGTQFYIVWGRKMSAAGLKKAKAALVEKGVEMSRFIQDEYEVIGGTPHLDGSYTVFGEVVEGLDIVRQIQQVPTDSTDRPVQDVVILHSVIE